MKTTQQPLIFKERRLEKGDREEGETSETCIRRNRLVHRKHPEQSLTFASAVCVFVIIPGHLVQPDAGGKVRLHPAVSPQLKRVRSVLLFIAPPPAPPTSGSCTCSSQCTGASDSVSQRHQVEGLALRPHVRAGASGSHVPIWKLVWHAGGCLIFTESSQNCCDIRPWRLLPALAVVTLGQTCNLISPSGGCTDITVPGGAGPRGGHHTCSAEPQTRAVDSELPQEPVLSGTAAERGRGSFQVDGSGTQPRACICRELWDSGSWQVSGAPAAPPPSCSPSPPACLPTCRGH